MAKIEEAKDVNTIQLLDKAVPPDKKTKPRRGLVVILCTLAAFFISVFAAFFFDFVEKMKLKDEAHYIVLLENLRGVNFKEYFENFKTLIKTRKWK